MKLPRLASGKTWCRVFLSALLAAITLAFFLGTFRDGYLWESSQRVDPKQLLTWLLYSSANSGSAVLIVVVVSSVAGGVLGYFTGERTRLLWRWLELTSSLPAVLLALLWLTVFPRDPLIVLTVVVSAQRTLQVAALVNQAEVFHLPPVAGSLYPVPEFEVARVRRRLPLLWVAAAHSAVLLSAEHAALVLLGLSPVVANTWATTLCAALLNPSDVPMLAVLFACGATVLLPLALWAQRDTATRRPPTLDAIALQASSSGP